MPFEPGKLADMRIKHLEMIQAVVARIAGQGASLKNLCITLTTAVCGFAITLQKPVLALLSLLPITIFSLLDAQYLRIERRFRGLFEQVRGGNWETLPSFEINLKAAHWGALRSWSIVAFYLTLAVAPAQ
jgi:hypothetical protein